jgi:hypothetical protein
MASLPAASGAEGGDSDQVVPSLFTLRGDRHKASAPVNHYGRQHYPEAILPLTEVAPYCARLR